AGHPEHRAGFELLDHLQGDVSVVVAQEQGPEPHHEVEDLVCRLLLEKNNVAVVRQKGVWSEVADVALDPARGQPAGAAPQLGALLVPREILPAELLGGQRITSRRKRGRPGADIGTPGPFAERGAETPRRLGEPGENPFTRIFLNRQPNL